ncbi:MAG TPA: GvpL/GvpF family gas vesicle protein [Myxococcales bacterium]|nr:GvpL/GvpF family gas vesicle protein [Myxococcales bacterium]
MSTPFTYVYCLLLSPRRPSLVRMPRGLPGAGPVRVLEGGEQLWLVVADAPEEHYSEAAIDRGLKDLDWVSACAVGHQSVIERCTRARSVVPMKLFTLFRSDDRAVAHVRGQRRLLRRLAERVSGQRELGVRILFDDARAARDAERAASRSAKSRGGAGGTGFLMRKQALRNAGTAAAAEARDRADSVYAALSRLSSDATRRTPEVGDPTAGRLVLDAAFLVPASKVAAFRAAVKRVVKPLPDCDEVTLTGPWPPYSFVAEAG